MPVNLDDEIDEGGAGNRRARFDEPSRHWWKGTGKLGRAAWIVAACLILGGFAWAFHASKAFLEHDSRFRIAESSDIQASGLSVLTRQDLMPVFGEDIGRNVFYVPLSLRRQQLEQLPWVQRATVMRVLPDQIRVSLVERQPVAFARHGNQFGLVDANGVLLSMPVAMMTARHYSFPVLTGIDDHDSAQARKDRMDLYLRMKQELSANGGNALDQVSEINLTDPENARVLMQEQGSDILADFGKDHFLERYQRFESNIKDWRQQYPDLAEVDLRYDHQAVLEMKHSAPSNSSPVAADPGKPKDDSKPGSHAQSKSGKHTALTRTAARKTASHHSVTRNRASKSHHAQLKVARRGAKNRRKTSTRTRGHESEARASHARSEQGL